MRLPRPARLLRVLAAICRFCQDRTNFRPPVASTAAAAPAAQVLSQLDRRADLTAGCRRHERGRAGAFRRSAIDDRGQGPWKPAPGRCSRPGSRLRQADARAHWSVARSRTERSACAADRCPAAVMPLHPEAVPEFCFIAPCSPISANWTIRPICDPIARSRRRTPVSTKGGKRGAFQCTRRGSRLF